MEPSACCLSGLEMFEMPHDAVVLVMGGGVMGLMTAAFAKLRGRADSHHVGADRVPAKSCVPTWAPTW